MTPRLSDDPVEAHSRSLLMAVVWALVLALGFAVAALWVAGS